MLNERAAVDEYVSIFRDNGNALPAIVRLAGPARRGRMTCAVCV